MMGCAAARREGTPDGAKVGKKLIVVVHTAAPVGAHARRGTAGSFLAEKPVSAPSLHSGPGTAAASNHTTPQE